MLTPPPVPPTVLLFVPGDRPDRFPKAAASAADAVILDLEDSVAPERKAAARGAAATHALRSIPVVIRVNGRRTAWFPDDLAAIEHTPFSALMLPKTETAKDIETVHQGLDRFVPVIPLIETAAGLANLPEILRSPGVVRVAFGALDFALDMGCGDAASPVALARCQILLQSRAAGRLPPIDGITASINDNAEIEAAARTSSEMGFGGKLAIHPNQVVPIRRGFAVDSRLIAWAQSVVAATSSGGVRCVDGSMIDAPIVARARRILSQAGLEP